MKLASKKSLKSGFTLAESVIALGILVVLITGFLAVFGPATTAIRNTLSGEEASRMQSALEVEMSQLREGREKSQYGSSLEKAFDWIARSHQLGGSVFVYHYRADLAEVRSDGSYAAREDVSGVAGQDFLIQPMVRRLDDPLLQEDFDAIEGRVFFVKMTQLVFGAQGLSVSEDIEGIADPHNEGDDFTTNVSEYPEATVLFEAQFFRLPTRSYNYATGAFDPTEFTRPVFRRNMGVSR